jgi:hypothetical protein
MNGNPFGRIDPPDALQKFAPQPGLALGSLLNLTFRLMIIGAAIYTVFNLIMAGYGFLGAADDSKKIAASWAKIWQSLLGLAVAAGAFVLARIFGQLIFKDPTFLLNPVLPRL